MVILVNSYLCKVKHKSLWEKHLIFSLFFGFYVKQFWERKQRQTRKVKEAENKGNFSSLFFLWQNKSVEMKKLFWRKNEYSSFIYILKLKWRITVRFKLSFSVENCRFSGFLVCCFYMVSTFWISFWEILNA